MGHKGLDTEGKLVGGVYLPSEEEHMAMWMTSSRRRQERDGRLTYQWLKQKRAMQIGDVHLPYWHSGVFVDVGAHVGTWSMWWGQATQGVIAYEPIEEFRTLYAQNCKGIDYVMVPRGLSDVPGEAKFRLDPKSTGATRIYAPGEEEDFPPVTVRITTLDSSLPLYLEDRKMTALKIDCEGYEEKVIRGGEHMIRKHLPLIVVEQKFEARHYGFEPHGAVALLESYGYIVAKVMAGDFVLIHPQAPGYR